MAKEIKLKEEEPFYKKYGIFIIIIGVIVVLGITKVEIPTSYIYIVGVFIVAYFVHSYLINRKPKVAFWKIVHKIADEYYLRTGIPLNTNWVVGDLIGEDDLVIQFINDNRIARYDVRNNSLVGIERMDLSEYKLDKDREFAFKSYLGGRIARQKDDEKRRQTGLEG